MFIKLPKGQAVKLIKSIEKALADAKKPSQVSGNQSSTKEYFWYRYGECLSVNLIRDNSGSTLGITAMDRHGIKFVHLYLKVNEAKAQSFLSILQKATASMKK